MSSTVILDDVIQKNSFKTLQSDFFSKIGDNPIEENLVVDQKWYTYDEDHLFKDICISFLQLTNSYFDLSSCTGYEFWIQNNRRPGRRHIDKDQQLLKEKGIYSFPLCSIIYYISVDENLVGGKLDIEDDIIITPKTNRMVIFPPGKYHYVQPFQGQRVSLLINPWDKSKYFI